VYANTVTAQEPQYSRWTLTDQTRRYQPRGNQNKVCRFKYSRM